MFDILPSGSPCRYSFMSFWTFSCSNWANLLWNSGDLSSHFQMMCSYIRFKLKYWNTQNTFLIIYLYKFTKDYMAFVLYILVIHLFIVYNMILFRLFRHLNFECLFLDGFLFGPITHQGWADKLNTMRLYSY